MPDDYWAGHPGRMARRRQQMMIPIIQAALEAARPAYDRMLRLAKEQLDKGEWDAVVVFAGAAAELVTASAIQDMLRALRTPSDVIDLMLPDDLPTTITNRGIRRIYDHLSDEKIQQATFWEEYLAHNRRRNALVHRGERCDEAGARASLKVVGEYMDHLFSVVEERGEILVEQAIEEHNAP